MRERINKILKADDTRSRAARGGAILAVASTGERALRLGRNMVLARILAPDQFGLMAMVMVISAAFEAISEVGIRLAVIQNQRGDTDAFLNISWWFGAVRGVLIFGGGYAIAPWISELYETPELTELLRVGMLAFFFNSIVSPRLAVMQKELRFGAYTLVRQGSGLLATIVALVCVIWIPNVWALVIGFVSEPAIKAILSFIVCPIRPSFRFDRELSGEFFTFVRRIAFLGFFAFLVARLDIFVLSKLVTIETVGMYSLASSLADLPRVAISRVIGPLLLPIFARVQDKRDVLAEQLLQVTRAMLALVLPVTAGLIVFARPVLGVTFGEQYQAMTQTFQLLCLYLVIGVLTRTLMSAYIAIGRPDYQRWFSFARLALLGVSMYPLVLYFGTVGAAASCLLSLSISFGSQVVHLRSLLGLPIGRFVAQAGPGLVLSGGVVVLGVPAVELLDAPDIIKVAIAGVLVGAMLAIGARDALKALLQGRQQAPAAAEQMGEA